MKFCHFLNVPFTGLGLYNGFRGNHWLKNRIQIFKQFVVPSLLNQTNKDFILWISWRHEERNNKQVKELKEWLHKNTNLNVVFTYSGIYFWDDKYSDDVARLRLINAIHRGMGELINVMPECDNVLMTIQPSDDCYENNAVKKIQNIFRNTDYQALTYKQGYICNYVTKEIAEYNPLTNPPFYTIKFPVEVFKDPLKHIEYANYKSHEYIGQKLKLGILKGRGFIVGCHGENISTFFDHPFKGKNLNEILYEPLNTMLIKRILSRFGLQNAPLLKIRKTWRGFLFTKIPHKVRRKLRYYLGELFYAKLYG